MPLTRQTLEQGRLEHLHALFDAGAGKSDAGVRALLDLAGGRADLDVTLRACRYPHRLRAWKALASGLFVPCEEEGAYVGAPPKEIRLAETQTVLKGENPEQAVRTIICREIVPGPKKDRWHPLFTTSQADPEDVLTIFRVRQNHEQAYRVGVYDEFLSRFSLQHTKNDVLQDASLLLKPLLSIMVIPASAFSGLPCAPSPFRPGECLDSVGI